MSKFVLLFLLAVILFGVGIGMIIQNYWNSLDPVTLSCNVKVPDPMRGCV